MQDPVRRIFALSTLFAFLLVFVCSVQAQQTAKNAPRVGFIFSTGSVGEPSPYFDAFQEGLREFEYVDGKNILIERRYAEGRLDRMPQFVHEFVQQRVDIIVAVNNVVIRAAKEATK